MIVFYQIEHIQFEIKLINMMNGDTHLKHDFIFSPRMLFSNNAIFE